MIDQFLILTASSTTVTVHCRRRFSHRHIELDRWSQWWE